MRENLITMALVSVASALSIWIWVSVRQGLPKDWSSLSESTAFRGPKWGRVNPGSRWGRGAVMVTALLLIILPSTLHLSRNVLYALSIIFGILLLFLFKAGNKAPPSPEQDPEADESDK